MDDGLDQRVAALERAVTDGEYDFTALADEAETIEHLDAVEEQVSQLSDRVAELEAATQALRGYVGNIRAVNEDVEQRADAALAKVETLERTVETTHSAEPDSELTGETEGRENEWTVQAKEPASETATVVSGAQRADENASAHCVACGHPQEQTQPPTEAGGVSASSGNENDCSPDTQRDDSSGESANGQLSTEDRQPEQPEETLVPERTETGAIQRLRQLL